MTAGGCSVYSDRPAVCRKFECAYVANDWAEYLRPDKCGVMIANFGGVYAALRLFEKVDNRIMDQIKFMAKEYGLRIEGIDARVGA
jgi:Fe-S-cluster containining protein